MNNDGDEGDDECDGCELSAAVSGLGDAEASGRRPINNTSPSFGDISPSMVLKHIIAASPASLDEFWNKAGKASESYSDQDKTNTKTGDSGFHFYIERAGLSSAVRI
jgi:hypothetical protein